MQQENFVKPNWHTITPWNENNSIGNDIRSMGGTTINGAVSTVFPLANRAIFIPFSLSAPALVKRMFCGNGAVVSGNIDVGIYASDGTRLVSSGSTAQAGTSALQYFDITDTFLDGGLYYMAVAMNNVTGTLLIATIGLLASTKTLGMAQMASAFALPTTATFATVTNDYIPVLGIMTS